METGWMTEGDFVTEDTLVLSIGFLIKETVDFIVIASDTDSHGNHNGRTQIPTGMVRKVKVIKKQDGNREIQDPVRPTHLPE